MQHDIVLILADSGKAGNKTECLFFLWAPTYVTGEFMPSMSP
jgi:hypothetical protein